MILFVTYLHTTKSSVYNEEHKNYKIKDSLVLMKSKKKKKIQNPNDSERHKLRTSVLVIR